MMVRSAAANSRWRRCRCNSICCCCFFILILNFRIVWPNWPPPPHREHLTSKPARGPFVLCANTRREVLLVRVGDDAPFLPFPRHPFGCSLRCCCYCYCCFVFPFEWPRRTRQLESRHQLVGVVLVLLRRARHAPNLAMNDQTLSTMFDCCLDLW